jgi:MinD superfamily P-loop ATPase
MKIAVLSGKGGTGKTTVATNLAAVLASSNYKAALAAPILIDCDVEEPNAALFFPEFSESLQIESYSVPIFFPRIDPELCTNCGKCAELCNFGAIIGSSKKTLVQPELCHDCGACGKLCPQDAISFEDRPLGEIHSAYCREGSLGLISGSLSIGEHSGVKVITKMLSLADEKKPKGFTIIDAPPGTNCSTVEAVEQADLAVIVTEATPFGLSDMTMVVEMLKTMKIPMVTIINKSGLGNADIQAYCDEEAIPILGHIPFHRKYAESYAGGGLLVDHHPELHSLFEELADSIIGYAENANQLQFLQSTVLTESRDWSASSSHSDSPMVQKVKLKQSDGQHLKEIVVISGKGGTGKTCVTSSIAPFLKDAVIADCDVDAPDLHILLKPEVLVQEAYSGMSKAFLDHGKCIECGVCVENCRFYAIRKHEVSGEVEILQNKCEGCGLCEKLCPGSAIEMQPAISGEVFESNTALGSMVHGRLIPGEEASGKLVSEVRKRARRIAGEQGSKWILVDGSPGVGCNVISSITGADQALVVTEPSVSALHDLRRVLDVAARIVKKIQVIINKADLSLPLAEQIRNECKKRGVAIIVEIPFDEKIPEQIGNSCIPALAETGFFSGDEWSSAVRALNLSLSQ